ncbi:MAG: choice-of-anchor D domain-containing protein, partial [Calditrichaeota bacterium]
LDISSNDPDDPLVQVTVTLFVNDAPIVDFDPDTLSFSLNPDETDSLTMTIYNLGAGPLDFTLNVTPPGGALSMVKPGVARVDEDALSQEFREDMARRTAVKGAPNILPETIQVGAGGDVSPYPQMLNGEECFGSSASSFSGGLRDRGNIFEVTTATTLLEYKAYLSIPQDVELYFFVYEGDVYQGIYTKINEVYVPSSGTGEGFYSSGPVNVPLQEGKFYYLGVSWGNVTVTYFRGSETTPLPTSFGFLRTGIPSTLAGFPPGPTIDQTWDGFPPYYCCVVTGPSVGWLSTNPSAGTIPPGGSMDVQVVANTAGLLGGNYSAEVHVLSNDPVTPDTAMTVNLFVSGTPDIDASPNPLDFPDPIFVGLSETRSLTIFNTGNIDLNVSDITSDNPDYTVTPTSFAIPPFDSMTVDVTFAPSAAGPSTATLAIAS